MIVLKKYSKFNSAEIKDFYTDLKSISLANDPAATNMWHQDWPNKNHTLPYILDKKKRFNPPQGEFHILYNDNEFIACGGVYKADFNDQIAMAGTRTWVDYRYRNQALIGDYILPEHKQWAMDHGCKAVALCFNDYNKNIINIFKRNRLGERNGRISGRTEKSLFFSNLNQLEFPVSIQYTKQWVIYESLDSNWNYDWQQISYQDASPYPV